jgi:LPXTG-motif cell wall-anchored protein
MLMFESWRLVLQGGARLLLVGGALTYSALAPALGLGEITLHSALNQPLSADIALVDVGGLEEGELSVSLATADEFGRAGVERVLFLNNLKFTPVLRGDRGVIRVTSSKAVKEPFLDFVVQLNQPNGRLLREYTVLIDPPDPEAVDPVADEPVVEAQPSAFADIQPAKVSSNSIKEPASTPVAVQPAVPVSDPVVAEQLAASVLQNQQLQKTVYELNAKFTAQDEQIAGQKKQVTELQTRLAELNSAATEPAVPVAAVVEEPQATNGLLMAGLLGLVALALLLFRRKHRREEDALPEASPDLPSPLEPMFHPVFASPENSLQDAGLASLKLQDYRASHPKLNSAPPLIVMPVDPVSNDEYHLKLDDASMDSSWDLVNPFDSSPSLDDSYLDEFSNTGQSLELEPLNLKLKEPI